jgi:hypothetical protein
MIPGMKDKPYMVRLNLLKLWTLEERRNRADLIEVFKMFSGITDLPVSTFFQVDRESTTRGHSLKIKKKFSSVRARKYFFSERVVNRWNKLSQECVSAPSLNSFKQQLVKIRETKMGFFMD